MTRHRLFKLAGSVTRLCRSVASDCSLNHDQPWLALERRSMFAFEFIVY